MGHLPGATNISPTFALRVTPLVAGAVRTMIAAKKTLVAAASPRACASPVAHLLPRVPVRTLTRAHLAQTRNGLKRSKVLKRSSAQRAQTTLCALLDKASVAAIKRQTLRALRARTERRTRTKMRVLLRVRHAAMYALWERTWPRRAWWTQIESAPTALSRRTRSLRSA